MDTSPAALGRRSPILGLLLIAEGATRMAVEMSRTSVVDFAYAPAILLLGIAVGLRTKAAEHRVACRLLLPIGIGASLLTTALRAVSPYPSGMPWSLGQVLNILAAITSNALFGLGACGLWGAALALREDGSNRLYRRLSLAGAAFSLLGFGVSLITEGVFVWSTGMQYLSQLKPSVYSALNLVVRLCLVGSVALALRRGEGAEFARRQTWIARLMLGGAATGMLMWLYYASAVLFHLGPSWGDWRRNLWLASIGLTLYLLNPLLLALSFRKPAVGYNPAGGPNSSGGAGAV